MITPAKVTPSRSGLHPELTSAPSSAKSQSGAPPTASILKTCDQPEEPNWKRSRPSGNNASTGISRVPPTRQQLRRPTSDRPDAPPLVVAIPKGSTRTNSKNGVRAGRPRPADSTGHSRYRVSMDFLYRQPARRARIKNMRTGNSTARPNRKSRFPISGHRGPLGPRFKIPSARHRAKLASPRQVLGEAHGVKSATAETARGVRSLTAPAKANFLVVNQSAA